MRMNIHIQKKYFKRFGKNGRGSAVANGCGGTRQDWKNVVFFILLSFFKKKTRKTAFFVPFLSLGKKGGGVSP